MDNYNPKEEEQLLKKYYSRYGGFWEYPNRLPDERVVTFVPQHNEFRYDEDDSKNEEREEFYQSYLVPPHGKSASQNIMNAILGEEEYKSIN